MSFQNFMNQSQHPPLHMAAFLDNFLSKSIVGMSSQDIEETLNQVIRLFCCLHERDTFVKNCEHYLHLRLLNKKMQSKEVEEQLIKKIQGESGFNAGAKMTSMFKDMDLSKTITDQFNTSKQNQT